MPLSSSVRGFPDPENRLLMREARDMALPQLVEATSADVSKGAGQR